MAKPTAQNIAFQDELVIIGIPLISFKKLSDFGVAKGKTAAQVIDEALTTYLERK